MITCTLVLMFSEIEREHHHTFKKYTLVFNSFALSGKIQPLIKLNRIYFFFSHLCSPFYIYLYHTHASIDIFTIDVSCRNWFNVWCHSLDHLLSFIHRYINVYSKKLTVISLSIQILIYEFENYIYIYACN